MCYCSKGLDLLRRTLCLFLCIVLLLCFFLVPRAHAVVAEAELAYWGGAIVVSVLAAGGMALATGDAQKVGSAMWTALKDTGGKAWDSICGLASWAAAAGSKAKDAAFRVGADVWQAISDLFNKSYSDGEFSLPVSADLGFYVNTAEKAQAVLDAWDYDVRKPSRVLYIGDNVYTMRIDSSKVVVHWNIPDMDYWEIYIDPSKGNFTCFFVINALNHYTGSQLMQDSLQVYAYVLYETGDSDRERMGSVRINSYPWVGTFPAGGEKVAVTGDLVYPSDDYLVKVPDIPATDSVTGALAWPSDAVYTKDAIAVPYPVDAAGEKVADIPFDVPVDQTTGKDITADTGTDVKPDVKPGAGTDTDTGTDVKWPTETDLSLPKLIITKFPFCIPFDVARLIGLLEADPKAPIFKVPLKYGAVMDEEITLDLSQFSDAIRIVRWGELILFVAGLAYVTRNYIKW